jgi:hypothetical protein
MSGPVLDPPVKPIHGTKWGLMLLGFVCLGIGLCFATGAFVDLDYMSVNHLNGWPFQVVLEISIAIMLIGFGPWCFLLGIRRHK